jgi:tetratricopeptide (TPR) repeat protein
MSGSEVISLLNEFLTARARSSVARLRDPDLDHSSASEHLGIFTGFFISPTGHLLTAFHPLKHKLWDRERTAEFELDMEFDVTGTSGGPGSGPVRVNAVCAPGWSDFKADWALLTLDYAPGSYLPVAKEGHLRPPQVDLCSAVRAYGFTEDQPDRASLGAYEGQYARAFPERAQFRMGFVDRGVGQSGGPVLDLRSRTVIGVVSGLLYQRRELLTADAAVIDQATFARLELEADLGKLADDWRGLAAEYLSGNLTEFRLLAADRPPPRLPDTYLRGRGISRNVLATLIEDREPVIFLHGARGSGKTSLAIEAVGELSDRGIVESIFWYDFDQPKKRSGDQLIPSLALHMMMTQGAFESLERYAYGQTGEDNADIIAALSAALREGRHALVFENIHYPYREQRTETLLLLERLSQAAAAGQSRVVFTSWDAPREPLRFTARAVQGLSESEVAAYFQLYGLNLSATALRYIRRYADDIVCLEMFVRSPEWRDAIESGQDLPREPEPLLSYWVTRYTKEHVPAPALRILLALAVMEQPAEYDALEAVSAVGNFHETLELLRTSPPLVVTGEGASDQDAIDRRSDASGLTGDFYSAHLNVRRAVLASADKKQIIETHKRAADFWSDRRDFATAARHRLRSGDPDGTLALIRDNRESIIAAGRLSDLEVLANELLGRSLASADAPYALHIILASCSNIRGDYADSCKHWSFALRNPPDELATAMLCNRRGNSYRLASEYGPASSDYSQAVAAAAANPSVAYRKELGRAWLGLAKLDRLKGDYHQAREHYAAARDAFEECFDEQGLIETSFGIGEVTRLTCDWPGAYQAYSDSLVRSRNAGNTEREAYALWGLGEVMRLTEDYVDAEATHRQGLEYCIKVSDTRSEGWALLGLAETHRATSALDRALAAYEQATERFARTKSGTEIAHATLGWCEAERAAGRFHFDQYEMAEKTYRDKGLRHCLLLCCIAKAAALRMADRMPDADACLAEAHELAVAANLDHELSVVRSMLGDPAAVPSLPLNFP